MKEGKRYRHTESGGDYVKKNGLLYVLDDGPLKISALTMNAIACAEFEEVVDYKTFEEAVQWMKEPGKNAEYNGIRYYVGSTGLLRMFDSPYTTAVDFNIKMLEPKWMLLEEES